MSEYYNGTKLLSMKDLNGEKPEIYMCTTNRTGGKTTYFNSMVVRRFLKTGKKFCLIYRYNYELDDVADKFFKDIKGLYFSNYFMSSKRRANGIFHELFISDKPEDEEPTSCGYAISLNSSDQIKKYSHLLSDIDSMIFDEFQSESNHYCNDEVTKFISIHTSLARGHGEQVKYLPVYMLSNQVSIINPYYIEMGISSRLQSNTNFLRGDGFVLENGFIESASKAQATSGFNRAFVNNAYVSYASENVYLNDNLAFVEKPEGVGKYLCTLRYNGCDYGVREYANEGLLYCDNHADSTFTNRISVTTEDHNVNYVMLRKNNLFMNQLREYFELGCFRFKDLRAKECLMKAISY